MTSSAIDSNKLANLPSAGDRQYLSQNTNESELQLRLLQPGQRFPLRTSTHTYKQQVQPEAADIDVVINHFADSIVIIVTDISKPGSIFHITKDRPKTQNVTSKGGSDFLYSVELLLGTESPELVTTARFLAQSLNEEKPILLTLGFKDPKVSLAPFQAKSLISFIKEHL